MRLLFKQRFFSWLDSYDVYDENGNTVFMVEGKLSWGHKLEIYDWNHSYLGMVKEEVFSFLPRFAIYEGSQYVGHIKKEFTFFTPRFTLEYRGWTVQGNFLEWEYKVVNNQGQTVMTASKELFRLTDTYVIDVADERDALTALMIVLAIDAAKCSQNSN